MSGMNRSSGILLHITSLPSMFGIGDLGPEALKFVDSLHSLNQHYWNILPLTPTSPEEGNSPYKSNSAFAGNPLLVSPELLFEDKLISKIDVEKSIKQPLNKVNFSEVTATKVVLLEKAYENFKKSHAFLRDDFDSFCEENQTWLEDYALYLTLRKKIGTPWYQWPASIRNREVVVLTRKRETLSDQVNAEKFVQFIFFKQLHGLKTRCNRKRVKILGDLSFYISYDSADVWANQDLFKLNDKQKPLYVAGVPPDYFSKTGQLWGSPVYNWSQLKKTDYKWWLDRIQHNLRLCDILRFDHFRGFVAYWQVPAKALTAKSGRWIRAPAATFFKAVRNRFPSMPFVAEDLGSITPSVIKVIKHLKVPGMNVLLFGFSDHLDNPNFIMNLTANSVVYTGTHDNNTARGWFIEEATRKEKKVLFRYLKREITLKEVSFELVKMAFASKPKLCIIPLQDALGLGSDARFNNPSRTADNWNWRASLDHLNDNRLQLLKSLAEEFNRV